MHIVGLHCLTLMFQLKFLKMCLKKVFVVHPISVATVDGTTVDFTCTANDSEEISYRVNGTSATFARIKMIGFVQSYPEELSYKMLQIKLTVSVSSLYNNTAIFCRALPMDVSSNIAYLTIQGGSVCYLINVIKLSVYQAFFIAYF